MRAAVLDKERFRLTLPILSSQQLDIANEILIIDGATPAFCRSLRVQFNERSKKEKHIRPFKNTLAQTPEMRTVCS